MRTRYFIYALLLGLAGLFVAARLFAADIPAEPTVSNKVVSYAAGGTLLEGASLGEISGSVKVGTETRQEITLAQLSNVKVPAGKTAKVVVRIQIQVE